jgi:hypothetical protein
MLRNDIVEMMLRRGLLTQCGGKSGNFYQEYLSVFFSWLEMNEVKMRIANYLISKKITIDDFFHFSLPHCFFFHKKISHFSVKTFFIF